MTAIETSPKETAPFQIARTALSSSRRGCSDQRAGCGPPPPVPARVPAPLPARTPGRPGRLGPVQPMLATAGPLPAGPAGRTSSSGTGCARSPTSGPAGLLLIAGSAPRSPRPTRSWPGWPGWPADVAARRRGGVLRGRPAVVHRAGRADARARRGAGPPAGRPVPVTYMIFDVLRLNGVDLTGRPYAERRATLERLALDGRTGRCRRCSPTGRPPRRPPARTGWRAWSPSGWPRSTGPGTATADWVKVRNGRRQDFVVGGWAGEGGRSGGIGALLVGVSGPDGRLVYPGRVGGGITAGGAARAGAARCGRCVTRPVAVRGDAAGGARAADHLGTAGARGRGGVRASAPRTAGCGSRGSCGCARQDAGGGRA